MRTPAHSELRELSAAECRARLSLADAGHLAINSRALPLVIPVEVDDLGPELRITSLLSDRVPLQEGSVVALEVGTFGGGRRDGWSVSVRGLLRRIRPQDADEVRLVVRPAPQFALSMELLTGWTRTSSAYQPPDDEPTQCPIVATGKEMTMQQAWLEDLSIEECVALLRGEAVGRIAFVIEELPVVLPVNYHLLETPTGIVLTLRTRPDGPIDRAPQAVALEIDGIDHSHQRGWSVLVRGSLRHVAARDRELRERFRVVPWLPAEPDVWLVIEPVEISGRRLQAATIEWAFRASAYL